MLLDEFPWLSRDDLDKDVEELDDDTVSDGEDEDAVPDVSDLVDYEAKRAEMLATRSEFALENEGAYFYVRQRGQQANIRKKGEILDCAACLSRKKRPTLSRGSASSTNFLP